MNFEKLRDICPRVLFVSHEASLTGAPLMLLHLIRWLLEHSDIEPQVLLIRGGELVPAFEAVAPVTLISDDQIREQAWHALLRRASWGDPLEWPPPPSLQMERLLRLGARRALVRDIRSRMGQTRAPELIYLNSAASARALSVLPDSIPLITHIHEMTWALEHLSSRAPWATRQMCIRTAHYIAASTAVRSALTKVMGIDRSRVTVWYEAIDADAQFVPYTAVEEARREIGVAPDTFVVGSVGALNWRKGPDLFLHVAKQTLGRLEQRNVEFVWVGPTPRDDPTEAQVRRDLAAAGLERRVHFVGPRADPRPLMAAFDIFLLTSREDPFPLACLEAAALGKAVICFDAGGMSELIKPEERLVVPYLDLAAMSSRIVELLHDPSERAALGKMLARRVRDRHQLHNTAPALLEIMRDVIRRAHGRERRS